jgi:phosphatidylinositol-bisphosphatase
LSSFEPSSPSSRNPRLAFKPTYKYIPGTSEYDRRLDKKMRAPAWCDRVLWSGRVVCGTGGQMTEGLWVQDDIPRIAPIQYGRAEQEISDHKPVFAVLEMQVESTCTDQAALARRVVEVRYRVCV